MLPDANKRMKLRLYGLSPSKVASHLKQLKALQHQEWLELSEKAAALRERHETLQQEWSALQIDRSKPSQQAKQELSLLQAFALQKRAEFAQTSTLLEQQHRQYVYALSSLQEISAVFEQACEPPPAPPSAEQHELPPAREDSTALPPFSHDAEAHEPLSEALQLVSMRYLVGKRAGEPLYDDHGTLLAAQNEPITPELLLKIEQAGKIADLIVHLKFSE